MRINKYRLLHTIGTYNYSANDFQFYWNYLTIINNKKKLLKFFIIFITQTVEIKCLKVSDDFIALIKKYNFS